MPLPPPSPTPTPPLALLLQPSCLSHKYIRTPSSSHIYERPERIRAVMLGVAAGVARLEEEDRERKGREMSVESGGSEYASAKSSVREGSPDISNLLSGLSLAPPSGSAEWQPTPTRPSKYLYLPPVPPSEGKPGQILLDNQAVRYTHSEVGEMPFPLLPNPRRITRSGNTETKNQLQTPQPPPRTIPPILLSPTSPSSPSSSSSSSSTSPPPPLPFSLPRPPSTPTPTSPSKSAPQPRPPATPKSRLLPPLLPRPPPSSSHLSALTDWCLRAPERIRDTGCEFPKEDVDGLGLIVGDLYLGPGSLAGLEGCVQTVCQAIDLVCGEQEMEEKVDKAFCVIRPPGHHCGEDTPSGFCYINNVLVAAMHGYLMHDYDRAVVIDFDLHHGNGTQQILLSLNASTHSEDLLRAGGKPLPEMTEYEKAQGRRRRGWKGFYGSVHDIWSYPCEDGDLDLIKDASVSLGGHGQYIENIHLQPYDSEEDFYTRIYPKYLHLLEKAKVYMRETEADPERTVLLIRFTRDITAFANEHMNGKVISILEGGYSDRALTSASMAHVSGFFGAEEGGREGWWSLPELVQLEKATKKKRGGNQRLAALPAEYASVEHLKRTHALLDIFETHGTDQQPIPVINDHASLIAPPAVRRTLRDRKRPTQADATPPPAFRTLGAKPKAKSTTVTPVHAQPPRGAATEERPPRSLGVVGQGQDTPTHAPALRAMKEEGGEDSASTAFARELEISLAKMSLQAKDKEERVAAELAAAEIARTSSPASSGSGKGMMKPSARSRVRSSASPAPQSTAITISGTTRTITANKPLDRATKAQIERLAATMPHLESVTFGSDDSPTSRSSSPGSRSGTSTADKKLTLKFKRPAAGAPMDWPEELDSSAAGFAGFGRVDKGKQVERTGSPRADTGLAQLMRGVTVEMEGVGPAGPSQAGVVGERWENQGRGEGSGGTNAGGSS